MQEKSRTTPRDQTPLLGLSIWVRLIDAKILDLDLGQGELELLNGFDTLHRLDRFQ